MPPRRGTTGVGTGGPLLVDAGAGPGAGVELLLGAGAGAEGTGAGAGVDMAQCICQKLDANVCKGSVTWAHNQWQYTVMKL